MTGLDSLRMRFRELSPQVEPELRVLGAKGGRLIGVEEEFVA